MGVGIVTGAGRGMGLACAERLARQVDTLLLVDRDEATVTEAAKDIPGAEPFVLDVTDAGGVAALAERASALGDLRAVIHAAGISPTMADWRTIFTVDLVGTALIVEALRPQLTEGAAVVCFASMAPLLARVQAEGDVAAAMDEPLADDFLDRLHAAIGPSIEDSGLAYAWAKHGVQRLARREAVRLGRQGARICSISPGIIDTPQGRQESANHPSMAQLVQLTPLAREGRPEELAAVAAFLVSPDASFLTGVDVLVDGGVYAAVTAAI